MKRLLLTMTSIIVFGMSVQNAFARPCDDYNTSYTGCDGELYCLEGKPQAGDN